MLPRFLQEKLSKMKPSAEFSCEPDTGLVYTLATKDGIFENHEETYVGWPLYKLIKPTGKEAKRLSAAVKKGRVTLAQLQNTCLYSFSELLLDYNSDQADQANMDKQILPTDLAGYVSQILALKSDEFFAFINTSDTGYEFKFFETYEEMVDDFVSRHKLIPWEEMYNFDLEWTKIQIQHMLDEEGVPFYDDTIDDDDFDDDDFDFDEDF